MTRALSTIICIILGTFLCATTALAQRCYFFKNDTGGSPTVTYLYTNVLPVNAITSRTFDPHAQFGVDCYAQGTGALLVIGLNSGFKWEGVAASEFGYILDLYDGGLSPGTYTIVSSAPVDPASIPAPPIPDSQLANNMIIGHQGGDVWFLEPQTDGSLNKRYIPGTTIVDGLGGYGQVVGVDSAVISHFTNGPTKFDTIRQSFYPPIESTQVISYTSNDSVFPCGTATDVKTFQIPSGYRYRGHWYRITTANP